MELAVLAPLLEFELLDELVLLLEELLLDELLLELLDEEDGCGSESDESLQPNTRLKLNRRVACRKMRRKRG